MTSDLIKTTHSITLAHPAPASFVQQVGRALYEADLLNEFLTQIVYQPDRLEMKMITAIAASAHIDLARQLSRRAVTEFPASKVKGFPWYEIARFVLERWNPDPQNVDRLFHWGLQGYDRWVMTQLENTKAIYSYETACLSTFQAAKQQGIACIYDVPSPEHHFVENLLYKEQKLYPQLDTPYRQYCRELQTERTHHRRKEWELADVVITNSEFTKASYAEAGLDVEKVRVVPLGAPPIHPTALAQLPALDQPIRFLWAGTFGIRKGAHYLLQAWQHLQPKAKLSIFGSVCLPNQLLQDLPDSIEFAGSIPYSELQTQYRQADVLVFPTLCDGFGMVVTEAFAQGLPVITTHQAGASDLVKHGVNGLIIPAGDAQALAGALEWCMTHRTELQAMRKAALETAAQWQWSDYRRLLVAQIQDGLNAAGF